MIFLFKTVAELDHYAFSNQRRLHSPQSARIEPINPAAHIVNAQSISHKSHLRQVSQLRSLPSQLIKDAAVEGLLLLTATTQFCQIRIIQTGPVLREGLRTVTLDLPIRIGVNRVKNVSINHIHPISPSNWRFRQKSKSGTFIKLWFMTCQFPIIKKNSDCHGPVFTIRIFLTCHVNEVLLVLLAVARSTHESNQVPGAITAFLKSFLIIIITGTSLSQ